jgi:hypothetical protein
MDQRTTHEQTFVRFGELFNGFGTAVLLEQLNGDWEAAIHFQQLPHEILIIGVLSLV